MLDPERAWLAWAHRMATDLDPEPTVAAGGAGTAASRALSLHRL